MCVSCKWAKFNCSGFDFKHMPVIGKDQDGTVIVRCTEFVKTPFDGIQITNKNNKIFSQL